MVYGVFGGPHVASPWGVFLKGQYPPQKSKTPLKGLHFSGPPIIKGASPPPKGQHFLKEAILS